MESAGAGNVSSQVPVHSTEHKTGSVDTLVVRKLALTTSENPRMKLIDKVSIYNSSIQLLYKSNFCYSTNFKKCVMEAQQLVLRIKCFHTVKVDFNYRLILVIFISLVVEDYIKCLKFILIFYRIMILFVYSATEIGITLNSLYLAFWATNFISILDENYSGSKNGFGQPLMYSSSFVGEERCGLTH